MADDVKLPSIFEMCVDGALLELERGDFANAGRDYGRGVAFACRLIRARIAEGRLAERAVGRFYPVPPRDPDSERKR